MVFVFASSINHIRLSRHRTPFHNKYRVAVPLFIGSPTSAFANAGGFIATNSGVSPFLDIY
jgi:hypothetical protein